MNDHILSRRSQLLLDRYAFRVLMRMARVFTMLILLIATSGSSSTCPPRCQCYDNPNMPSESAHLICKWEQLNAANLGSLRRPDEVRTLTIRCPHFSTRRSSPPAGLFQGLRNLERLEIDRCHLSGLPSALFSGLQKLYSLIIKNAKLSTIPNDLFAYTPNLMTLDLTGNELQVEPYSLQSLRNLIHLDLSNNSIGFFANTLISLTKLKVLTIDHNRLTNVDFRRLPQELTDLSLRHNFINHIHYVAESTRNLRRIDLSDNQLGFLASHGAVNVLPPSLKQVDLSNNRIAFVQKNALAHMKTLAVLDLRGNRLRELKESSIIGPETRLRLFLERNPLRCHCEMRWVLHANKKASPVVLDLKLLTCSMVLNEDQKLNVTVADQLNLLICEYDTLCPTSCACCEEPICSCRSSCPIQCHCYHSANMERSNAQNVFVCKDLRADQLDTLPKTATELHIDAADRKRWNVEKLQAFPNLKKLHISNTPITFDEVNSLSSLPSLVELELRSTTLTKVPSRLGHLSRLKLVGNPLSQITADDIRIFDTVKRLSLGGNETRFTCDCTTPSPLQLWLREKRNRKKVEDVDSIMCHFHPLGLIPVISTLPGNASVCQQEIVETTKWTESLLNVERKNQKETNSQYWHPLTAPDISPTEAVLMTIEDRLKLALKPSTSFSKPQSSRTDRRLDLYTFTAQQTLATTDSSFRRMPATTPPLWRKYHSDNSQDKFLNALVFVLFVCVLILLMTIAFTLYYRFIRIGRPKHHKKRHKEA
ncbi:hypothetical protein Angca_008171, partial [Angiostrongylus cantonensis]